MKVMRILYNLHNVYNPYNFKTDNQIPMKKDFSGKVGRFSEQDQLCDDRLTKIVLSNIILWYCLAKCILKATKAGLFVFCAVHFRK